MPSDLNDINRWTRDELINFIEGANTMFPKAIKYSSGTKRGKLVKKIKKFFRQNQEELALTAA